MDPTIQKKVEMLQHIFNASTAYFHYWWFWVALIIGLIFSILPSSASDEEDESWSIPPLFLWIPTYVLIMVSGMMWVVSGPIIGNYASTHMDSGIVAWLFIGNLGAMVMFWRFPKRTLPAIIFVLTILVWPLLNELIFPSGMPVNALFIKGMWIISVEFLAMMTIMLMPVGIGGVIAVLGVAFIESSTEHTGDADKDQQEIERRNKRTEHRLNIILIILSFIIGVGFPLYFANKAAIFFVHPIEVYLLRITVLLLSVNILWLTVKAVSKRMVRFLYNRTDNSTSDETDNSASKV